MFQRQLQLPESHSFFLFGARATGKSTLLTECFRDTGCLYLDLLDPETEERLSRRPAELRQQIEPLDPTQWVVIDEIQKIPKLLDVVHQTIEARKQPFALTGSSARKLRRGSANMLAGRAFVLNLFPLTCRELQDRFDLLAVLQWGSLPEIFSLSDSLDRQRYLQTYARNYLAEEVWNEHLIRNLDPFRRFLEVAGQCNGTILNYSRIAEDVGVDSKTVQNYFQILEDTLIGFFLEPYHRSVRKSQRKSPKFYFFDLGVVRALNRTLAQTLIPSTYAFGEAFEHFVILEMMRQNHYQEKEYRFSYFHTHDDAEIDLVIDRPGEPLALVEIKSTDRVTGRTVAQLARLTPSFGNARAYCLSRDPNRKTIQGVEVLPWADGLEMLGLG